MRRRGQVLSGSRHNWRALVNTIMKFVITNNVQLIS